MFVFWMLSFFRGIFWVGDHATYAKNSWFFLSMKTVKIITIDLTNTIFKFKTDPPTIYATVAKEHGLICCRKQLKKSFLMVYSQMSKSHPNFGAATGIGGEKWWNQVIHRTFKGLHNYFCSLSVMNNMLDCFRHLQRRVHERPSTNNCWKIISLLPRAKRLPCISGLFSICQWNSISEANRDQ